MLEKFDIRKFIDRLQHAGPEATRYYCPACGGNDLTLNTSNGGYTCHSGCSPEEVREAVKPLAEAISEARGNGNGSRRIAKIDARHQSLSSLGKVERQAEGLLKTFKRGDVSEAGLGVLMAAWAKAEKEDVFAATQLMKERIREYKASPEYRAIGDQKRKDRGGNSKLVEAKSAIVDIFRERIRLNRLRNELEFEGKAINPESCRLFVAEECGIDLAEADARAILSQLGEYNSYHPVKDWMDELWHQYGDTEIHLLDNCAEFFLGVEGDPEDVKLYNLYLKNQLIAGVARVYKPGCKVDFATVLQGAGGIGKSTFWAELAGATPGSQEGDHRARWFDDSIGEAYDSKDELIKLMTWVVELAEFDRVTGYKEAFALKNYVSRQVDNYRVPYGKSNREYPRQCIIVGSVNPSEFLVDENGNRRFQVIPLPQRFLDIPKLKLWRDRLWSAAVAAFLNGQKWHLDDINQAIATKQAANFEQKDVWEEVIGAFLAAPANHYAKNGVPYITIAAILKHMEVPLGQQTNQTKRRVGKVLRSLGWEVTEKAVRLAGLANPVKGWYRVDLGPGEP